MNSTTGYLGEQLSFKVNFPNSRLGCTVEIEEPDTNYLQIDFLNENDRIYCLMTSSALVDNRNRVKLYYEIRPNYIEISFWPALAGPHKVHVRSNDDHIAPRSSTILIKEKEFSYKPKKLFDSAKPKRLFQSAFLNQTSNDSSIETGSSNLSNDSSMFNNSAQSNAFSTTNQQSGQTESRFSFVSSASNTSFNLAQPEITRIEFNLNENSEIESVDQSIYSATNSAIINKIQTEHSTGVKASSVYLDELNNNNLDDLGGHLDENRAKNTDYKALADRTTVQSRCNEETISEITANSAIKTIDGKLTEFGISEMCDLTTNETSNQQFELNRSEIESFRTFLEQSDESQLDKRSQTNTILELSENRTSDSFTFKISPNYLLSKNNQKLNDQEIEQLNLTKRNSTNDEQVNAPLNSQKPVSSSNEQRILSSINQPDLLNRQLNDERDLRNDQSLFNQLVRVVAKTESQANDQRNSTNTELNKAIDGCKESDDFDQQLGEQPSVNHHQMESKELDRNVHFLEPKNESETVVNDPWICMNRLNLGLKFV